jgi:hypothetical protein
LALILFLLFSLAINSGQKRCRRANAHLLGGEIKPQSIHQANRRAIYRNHFTGVPPENVETAWLAEAKMKEVDALATSQEPKRS